jgi:2-polyprenyl-3-methyl-5-hydroxy-6-metoxy-1,4-benzoquinol methylase
MSAAAMELRYEPLERLHVARPVDRIGYIVDACRERAVLDLGAMDETAVNAKRGRGTWLHGAIAAVAARVVGVDSSPSVPDAGLDTAPNARIVRGDIHDLARVLDETAFVPDVVVAGEVIEHLPNPLAFLRGLASIDRLRGRSLVLTTPNATALHNVAIGLVSRESTHVDHLCILSYKTLHSLCRRAGIARWEIIPYRAAFPEMRARTAGARGTVVVAGEKVVNALEWLFPLLSFGYIVHATI